MLVPNKMTQQHLSLVQVTDEVAGVYPYVVHGIPIQRVFDSFTLKWNFDIYKPVTSPCNISYKNN